MRVMAIGAHPDDIELLCAGTLAKYAQQGHQVTMCYVCNGGLGHVEIMPPELKEVRKQESIDSANVIGADFQWLDIDDADVRQSTNEAIARLIDAVREAQPDVIITHSPNDYMDDHRLVGELVLKASFDATIPHLVSKQETPAQLVPIFYMDTLMGVDFLPEFWVDISDTIETKRQMLACHESQYAWLKEHDNIDYIDSMVTVAKYRGLQVGTPYAEGFRQVRVWGRTTTVPLLPTDIARG